MDVQLLVARRAFDSLRAMRIIFLCLALAVSASGAEIKIDFTDFSTGQTPTNFHSVLAGGGKPGEWRITTDAVPPLLAPLTDKAPAITSRAVLAQMSRDQTDERFPMFIYDGETFQDFKLATRFKIVIGHAEQMAGVVFRFQNASNFYVIRASALGHNVRFYKVVNGQRSDPIGPQLDVSSGDWHTLAVQCQGNQIVCWFDDELVMPPLNDNTFSDGKIGFWTKSDAVSYFTDTTIDYKPRVPTAQSLVKSIMEQQPRILGLRIYTLDSTGQPRIIASKDQKEIGQPGTDAEKEALTGGKIFYGRGPGTVAITMPFRDRNGEAMAAMRVELKPALFESQDTTLTRATMVLKLMQAQVNSMDELMK
jgi:hypothetical protein